MSGKQVNPMDGHGEYTWTDGQKYVGNWKDGKKHGKGKLTWPVPENSQQK